MLPYQERVVAEKAELDAKLAKLREFCVDPVSPVFEKLSELDQVLLMRQYDVMAEYSHILEQRIARFASRG